MRCQGMYLVSLFYACPLILQDQTEQALQDLNVVFCELTSLLILAYSTQQVAPRNSKGRDSMSIEKLVSLVKSYVARLLRGASTSSHSVGWRITAQDYMALLPTVWMLLSSDLSHSGIGEDDTLGALLDHALQVSSASAIKRSTVDFLVRLTLVGFGSPYVLSTSDLTVLV
jgi:pre-rRNA-processing protein IPI1